MNLEKDWNQEKNTYIDKLSKVNDTINSFLEKDIGGFISNEVKEKLSICFEKSKIYKNKLEKDLFEIAIVGEENSGKSSFANALISSYAFPSAFKRCTYTTTQLEYGENQTIVDFYTRDEFNERFSSMLKDIEYPKYNSVYFDTLTDSSFNHHLSTLEKENNRLFKEHQGNTIEDIDSIIKGSKDIKEYIGSSKKIFDGHINDQIKKFITDEYISRAVKKITIHSSELKDLQNAIIFDVPGFTSPTKIHKDQTIEKLKSVDAIILIHNLANITNLSGPQVDIFNHGMDVDGIRLKEKLFIFGTKIDFHQSSASRDDCINEFRKDISKRDLADNTRVFIGSAGAYLAKNNIKIDEKNDPETVKNLIKFSENNDDYIEKLKNSLKKYYQTERFEILKRRIDNVINEVISICEDFIKNQETDILNFDSTYLSMELLIDIINKSKGFLVKELTDLREEIIHDIDENKFLSKKLNEDIDKPEYFDEITEDDYKEKYNLTGIDTDNISSPQAVNIKIREFLSTKFKNKFVSLITDLADKKYQEISDRILNKFLDSISVDNRNPYYKEIKESSINFLDSIFNKVSYQSNSFIFLAERFSIDLLEILILHHLGSTGRKDKFLAAEESFYSLAMFHSIKSYEEPIYKHPLIKTILTQNNQTEEKYDKNKIKSLLINEFEKLPKANSIIEMYDEYLIEYAVSIASKALGIESITYIISEIVKNFKENNYPLQKIQEVNYIGKIIKDSIDFISKNNNIENPKKIYIENLIKNIRMSDTKDIVIKEINNDINNLKMILKDAVIRAMVLEKPFKSIITKQIDFLKNKIAPQETAIDEDFKNLIIQNISKIKHSDFSNVAQKEALNENKKMILNSMKSLLSNLN